MVLVLIIATGPTNAKTRQDVYNVLENRLSLVGIKPSCFQKLHQSVCMPAEQMAGKRESMLSVSKDKAHGREEAESTSAKNTIQARRILAMRSTRCPPATSASYLISRACSSDDTIARSASITIKSLTCRTRTSPSVFAPQASNQGQDCRQKEGYSRRYAPGVGRYCILSSSFSDRTTIVYYLSLPTSYTT